MKWIVSFDRESKWCMESTPGYREVSVQVNYWLGKLFDVVLWGPAASHFCQLKAFMICSDVDLKTLYSPPLLYRFWKSDSSKTTYQGKQHKVPEYFQINFIWIISNMSPSRTENKHRKSPLGSDLLHDNGPAGWKSAWDFLTETGPQKTHLNSRIHATLQKNLLQTEINSVKSSQYYIYIIYTVCIYNGLYYMKKCLWYKISFTTKPDLLITKSIITTDCV